jgi:hypothetical protein
VTDETVSEPDLADTGIPNDRIPNDLIHNDVISDEAEPSNGELSTQLVAPSTGWHTGDTESLQTAESPGPVTALTPTLDPAKTIADRAAADRVAAEHASADATFERESGRRRERVLYAVVMLFALAIVVPMASIGVRVAMTAPTYMAPLLIQPVIVLTSVWLGARLGKRK